MKGSPVKFFGAAAAAGRSLLGLNWGGGSGPSGGSTSPGWPKVRNIQANPTGENQTNYNPEQMQQRFKEVRQQGELAMREQQMRLFQQQLPKMSQRPMGGGSSGSSGAHTHGGGSGKSGGWGTQEYRQWQASRPPGNQRMKGGAYLGPDDAPLDNQEELRAQHEAWNAARPKFSGRTSGLGGMMNAAQRGGGTGHSHNIGQSFFTKKNKI